MLHHTHHAFYDVVNVGEVATAMAIVEDFYGFTLDKAVCEAEIGHIRTAFGSIDGEKSEAGAGNVV